MMAPPPPFIPYYIDYNVKNQSKTIGVSKKKVTFKFGFANQRAIDEGLVGAHCRGSEHEVTFTWSLNSGKRHVTLDGKDVHMSTSGQNGWTSDRTWQHVFGLKVPGFSTSFRCHLISQPAPQGTNIRPFDLRVGGISIFKFNQIFQLGTTQMNVRKPASSRPAYAGGVEDDAMSPEERRLLAAARVESMREFRKQQERQSTGGPGTQNGSGPPAPAPPPAEVDLLMSFDGPPMPSPQMPGQFVSSLTVGSDFGSSTNSFPAAGAPPAYGYPQQQPSYPTQQQAFFGQSPPQQSNYAQSPFGGSFTQPSTSSLGGSSTTAPTANTSSSLTPYQTPAGQVQAAPGYSVSSSFMSFGTEPTQPSSQASAPSMAYSLDPYAKPPADPWATPQQQSFGQVQSPQQQSFGQVQSPQQQSFGQVQSPQQQSFGQVQSPQQQQQQPQPQYGGYASQSQSSFPALMSPTAESLGTYGSAPDFARPPQAQKQQYQQPQEGYGQPPSPYGQQPAYGQPQVPAGNPYAPPPQYQQQQFSGF